jgi:hypothetical protein
MFNGIYQVFCGLIYIYGILISMYICHWHVFLRILISRHIVWRTDKNCLIFSFVCCLQKSMDICAYSSFVRFGASYNKDKNTTVRFSVRNCTKYGCQMYSITKQQYSSDLWPLMSLKAKRNCIVDKSLKIIKLIIKKCSTFDP